jgi:hypothetical protein
MSHHRQYYDHIIVHILTCHTLDTELRNSPKKKLNIFFFRGILISQSLKTSKITREGTFEKLRQREREEGGGGGGGVTCLNSEAVVDMLPSESVLYLNVYIYLNVYECMYV